MLHSKSERERSALSPALECKTLGGVRSSEVPSFLLAGHASTGTHTYPRALANPLYTVPTVTIENDAVNVVHDGGTVFDFDVLRLANSLGLCGCCPDQHAAEPAVTV